MRQEGSWEQTYEPDGKSKVMLPTYLNGNSDIILTGVSRMERGMYNTKTLHSILACEQHGRRPAIV